MSSRGWANLARTLAITLAPAYVLVVIFWYFGFRLESILASILFVQIYIMVIQAEAMMKQAAWAEAAYDTSFKISTDVRANGTIISIENCGDKPAYNFFIGLRDEAKGQTLKYERRRGDTKLEESEAHVLSVGYQHTISIPILEEDFRRGKIALRIVYDNVLGRPREVRAVSFEKADGFFVFPTHVEPGFLTKAYGDLMLFTRWQFRYKKSLKK